MKFKKRNKTKSKINLFDLNRKNTVSQETISLLFSRLGLGLSDVDNHSFHRNRGVDEPGNIS